MSAGANTVGYGELPPQLCAHCQREIERRGDHYVFVVAGRAPTPFLVRIQPADFVVADSEQALDSVTCMKKWLFDWVNKAAADFMKGRA